MGCKSQSLFCMLSVRFIIHIKVEIMGGGGERNKGKLRRGSKVGKVSGELQSVVIEVNRKKWS